MASYLEITGCKVSFPVTESGNILGFEKSLLTDLEFIHDCARTEQIVNPVAENQTVDRLTDKICGTGVKGLSDRLSIIIPTSNHHDRRVSATWQAAKRLTGRKAVHFGHDDIEKDKPWATFLKNSQSLLTASGFHNLDFSSFECGSYLQSG